MMLRVVGTSLRKFALWVRVLTHVNILFRVYLLLFSVYYIWRTIQVTGLEQEAFGTSVIRLDLVGVVTFLLAWTVAAITGTSWIVSAQRRTAFESERVQLLLKFDEERRSLIADNLRSEFATLRESITSQAAKGGIEQETHDQLGTNVLEDSGIRSDPADKGGDVAPSI